MSANTEGSPATDNTILKFLQVTYTTIIPGIKDHNIGKYAGFYSKFPIVLYRYIHISLSLSLQVSMSAYNFH